MSLRGQVGMVIPLVFLVVFVMIAFNLAPTVANASTDLTIANSSGSGTGANMTVAGRSLVALLPLMYIVIIVVTILGFVAMRGE